MKTLLRVRRAHSKICRFFGNNLIKYTWSAETCSFLKIAKRVKSLHPTVVYTVQGTEKNDFYEKTRAARAFGHL